MSIALLAKAEWDHTAWEAPRELGADTRFSHVHVSKMERNHVLWTQGKADAIRPTIVHLVKWPSKRMRIHLILNEVASSVK